jgi:type II secretory pathway pseudopilin PulG
MSVKLSGFSLIEIAVVLIIIGLIGGMTLPALNVMLDWQKMTTTAERQEKILYALASYAVQNKILPYAANPAHPQGTQDTATRRRRGIVPYRDLGLPESIAKDGYQRWFTYVVDDYYAIIPRIGPYMSAAQEPISKLCEKHKHSNPLSIKGLQDTVALAIISHGPQGRGAYPNPLETPPQGGDETQNATSDTQIIDRPLSQDPQNPFSHKVVWVTDKNLMAIYARAPCPPIDNSFKPSKNRFQAPENPSRDKERTTEGIQ